MHPKSVNRVATAGTSRIGELFRVLCAFLIGIGIGFMYILYNTNTSSQISTPKMFVEEVESKQVESAATHPETEQHMTMRPSNSTLQPVLFLGASQIGRLGNLLFQYATAYGVAKTVGKRLYVTEANELLPLFPNIRQYAYVAKAEDEIANRRGVGDPKHCGFAPSVIQESRAAFNAGMGGYFQSWRYFDQYRAELRKHLRFADTTLRDSETQLQKVRKGALDALNAASGAAKVNELFWVAVHVRRGDIITPHFASYGYLVATPEYLRKSADYFVHKYATPQRAVVFLVVSDDSNWCKEHFSVSPESINATGVPRVHIEFLSNEQRELDMCIMTRCNATIMSVGSFGWWAAYLGGGETFYYAYPFRVGSGLSTQFVMEDYYPPDWHLFF